MNPLKILIVEDEIITATDLKETLETYGHKITGIAKTASEALQALESFITDLMIIDIRLRHSSFDGVELAEEVNRNYRIPFVYLTSHSETYTFERARTTKPAAYLLKPFRHRELAFQIELAYEHYWVNKKSENNPVTADNIFLPLDKGYKRISKEEILFIKAAGAYVRIYVRNDGAPLLCSMNIGYISQYFLMDNFYQISRSYIINLKHINRFDAENIYLNHYENTIPLPQHRRSELMKRLAVIKTPN
jgi:DNA-binding LytR/AlgR family response regulator